MSTTERIAVVLTTSGPVIGVLDEYEAGFFLKKPRGINIQQQGAGLVKIAFSELIGRPEQIEFTGDIAYYKPTEQNIVQGYLESTSRIKLATAMPPPQRQN